MSKQLSVVVRNDEPIDVLRLLCHVFSSTLDPRP
jgi:hypothetical protein